MSCPTTTVSAPTTWTKARPVARASVVVDLVGDQPPDVVRLEDRVDVGGVEGVGHAAAVRGGRARPMGQSVLRTRRWPLRPRLAAGLLRGSGPRRRGRAGGLADRVGQREQVVVGRPLGLRVGRQPEHLPAAGGGESLGVGLAQVVGVRLGVRRERAQDGRLVGVHVRQRVDRGTAARGARTATGGTHAANATPPGAAPIRLAAWTATGTLPRRGSGVPGTAADGACAVPA